jgi:hypothetical protein
MQSQKNNFFDIFEFAAVGQSAFAHIAGFAEVRNTLKKFHRTLPFTQRPSTIFRFCSARVGSYPGTGMRFQNADFGHPI